jgi:hypothetical protein
MKILLLLSEKVENMLSPTYIMDDVKGASNHILEKAREVLFANQALIGKIHENIRIITIELTQHKLYWRVYFNTPPTEQEYQEIKAACLEIFHQLPEVQYIHEEYRITPYPTPVEKLEWWVYFRHEPQP